MTRARELANFADNTAGLETLTVSDITDLSVSASNINSATNQITDSSTDLNVDSNTLVVDKSANRVGIGTTSPTHPLTLETTSNNTTHNTGDDVYNNTSAPLLMVKNTDATDNNILGGLRSACTYTGASKLKYLAKCTTFMRVHN